MNNLLISVVIPTFQRPDLLQRCLTALGSQTLPTDQFEVVVVDDGNDADTAALVRNLARQGALQLSYLGQSQRRGPAAARNRGWRAARSPIIAFTDDDCIPQPDWLRAALKRFDAGASVVTGRVEMPLPNRPTAHDRTTALLETAEFVTANCFCRRTALEHVGGFDEAFDIAWREDSALQFAFLRAGIPIDACPKAVLVHPLRPARWYAPLRDERKNRYDALLYKRYPNLFRARIPHYPALVTAYYGVVASALMTLGGAVAGNKSVVRAGGVGWLLLTTGLLAYRQANQPIGELPKNGLVTIVSPFLSVYWRLYGAIKHRVWYL
ncbi:glycosyltransferase family 2 protein [Spirosoma rhododendri]|uniref:Glycosyltransferase n=1 Tax=Spirosoma rhododendri TaxID=2728024 RepID=A0A7L5DRL8_9BACT|nr:glycosyltransferase [Spirosoma rhododendri]QJD79883.1 glycosyltransferase [Spirosoma rhododendri]